MKKNIIIALLLISSILTSCFEDKGNYDYVDMGEIRIIGLEKSYRRTSFKDNIVVPITVESTVGGENFKYMWGVHSEGSGTYQKIDTISHEKNLHYPVTLKPGNYTLFLKVTNTDNNLIAYQRAPLEVVTEFSDGWYVLKDSDNQTDIDMYINEEQKMENIIRKSTGHSLAGEAKSLGFHPEYAWNVYGETIIKNDKQKMIIPISTNDCGMFKVDDMSLIYDFNDMFYTPTSNKPIFATGGPTWLNLYTSSSVHFINTMSIAALNKFGNPLALDGTTNCEMDFHKSVMSNRSGVLMFDKIGSRFLCMNSSGGLRSLGDKGLNGVPAAMPAKDMNSDLLVMKPLNILTNKGTVHALMRKRDRDGLYLLDMNVTSLMMAFYNPIEKSTTLASSLLINKATIFGFNYDVPYIYFVSDKNVLNAFDCGTKKELLNLKTFAAGENITFIKNLIRNENPDPDGINFNYLVIGTQIGENYNIYVFNHQGGAIKGEHVYKFSGIGRAADIHRIMPTINAGNYILN